MISILIATIYTPLVLLFIAKPTYTNAACTNELIVCDGAGARYRPLPGCQQYALCISGQLINKLSCGTGSIYDVLLERCNWQDASFCNVGTCPPTERPTVSPSTYPSATPSVSPSGSPSSSPGEAPSASPSSSPTDSDFFALLETTDMKQKIENTVLVAYTPGGNIAYPSTKYTYNGLISALQEMSEGLKSDGKTFIFYTGEDERRKDYGRTNLAAFLAMAMVESIEYDTCDEFNTDQVAGRYAISNACGQNSRSYQDEVCTNPQEVDMACPVDTNMNVVSVGYSTNMMGRAPPPFSCRPKTSASDYAGFWDLMNGQSSNSAYSNALGRTDLEGCCWWGRGSLLTRGVCNIGKLNYYLGKRAFTERGEGRFPAVDFCKFPEATCTEVLGGEREAEDLKWITGMFEYIDRIQNYRGGWDYFTALKRFVDGGMKDDSFIDTVSSIFVRGCHFPNCSSLQVTKKEERKANFYKVLSMFGDPRAAPPPTVRPTPPPTTSRPTTLSPVKSIQPPSLAKPQQESQTNLPPPPLGTAPSTAWMQPLPTEPSGYTQPVNPTTINPFDAGDLGDELIPIEDNPATLLIVFSGWSISLLLVVAITLL